ncbi:MAG: hypothetical protein QM604_04215 [Microbacterium sp.]
MTTTSVPVAPPALPLPGRALGVAGFVLSLLAAFAPVGLVLSLVAFVQGRRARRTNGLALGGVILGAVGTVVLIVVAVASVVTLAGQTELCGIGDLIALECR